MTQLKTEPAGDHDDLHVLRTSCLEVHCNPACGGRISHFIPRDSGANQFHWNPPAMDLRQLSTYAPIGGWKEMVITDDCSFPGAHWNQPFTFERMDTASGPRARMSCDAGGLRLTRTVTLDTKAASMTIETECTNLTTGVLPGVRIQVQPLLTPGGTMHVDRVACLLPGEHDVAVRVLELPDIQPGMAATVEYAPHTNWWGCCDPDAGAALLIEDNTGETAQHNLNHDQRLLILHNVGPTTDLPPNGSLHMTLTLHYYAFDLAPLVSDLGASRLVADGSLLLGVKVSAAELAQGESALTARLTCLPLAATAPMREGIVSLLGPDGAVLDRHTVKLQCGSENPHAATGSFTFRVGHLPPSAYQITFTAGDDMPAVSSRFCIVRETRQQKRETARRDVATRIERLAPNVSARADDGFAGALLRQDLEAARTLHDHDATEDASQYLDFVEEALASIEVNTPFDFPHPQDLRVNAKWVHELEKLLPVPPPASRDPQHYGSAHEGAFLHGWHWRTDSRAAHALAWLAFHPDSHYYGKPAALCRAVLLVDSICRAYVNGNLPSDIARDRNVNRFTLVPLGEALRILVALPICEARKRFWKTRFREAVDYQIETYGGQPIPDGGYLNQDVMYLLGCRFAHEVFGDERYRKECDYILDMIEAHLLPDGAFYYIYPHNEVSVYHEINIAYLFRDFYVSGETRSRRLVEKTVRFYPLMISAGGWMEPSTQTWWKHTEGLHWPALGPAIVAGVTGDGQNQYLAQQATTPHVSMHGLERLMYASLAARDDITPEPPPDRFLVLDRNVRGPRGRCGPFSWAGTTAPYRDTLVGAMFSPRDDDKVHLMHYAGPQVFFSELTETNPHRNGVGLAMSPESYPSDVVIQDRAAVLGARYGLYQLQQRMGSPPPSDWVATQLWYFDPERMVGLMMIEACRDTVAHAIDLSARFGSYDASHGFREAPLDPRDDGTYVSGPLHLRVVEHNLEAARVEPTWVCTYTGDTPGKGVFVRQPSLNGTFAAGTRYYMLIEIRPESSAPAQIERRDNGVGFAVNTGRGVHAVGMTGKGDTLTCNLA